MTAVGIVAVGASLGGLHALRTLLAGLPAELGCAVVIVQHRRADPESRLIQLLASHSALPVSEPEDKTPIATNHVYVAPSDYHLLVDRGVLALSIDPPVSHSRPSIDVLFESVADGYGPAAVGVALTSSNDDGAAGALAIKRAGGRVFVEDPGSAESPVGPLAVLAKTSVDGVMPLEAIAPVLVSLCRMRAGTGKRRVLARRGVSPIPKRPK